MSTNYFCIFVNTMASIKSMMNKRKDTMMVNTLQAPLPSPSLILAEARADPPSATYEASYITQDQSTSSDQGERQCNESND